MQSNFLGSRARLRDLVNELFREHQVSLEHQQSHLTKDHPANGRDIPDSLLQKASAPVNELGEAVPEIRKGVKPGSFIDLLVRGSMKGSGESFTDNQKAQQVHH